jgi:hypothetical protein
MFSSDKAATQDAIARWTRRFPDIALLTVALGSAAVRVLAPSPDIEPMSTGRREFFVQSAGRHRACMTSGHAGLE